MAVWADHPTTFEMASIRSVQSVAGGWTGAETLQASRAGSVAYLRLATNARGEAIAAWSRSGRPLTLWTSRFSPGR
jgi:hypothetical protein